MGDAVKLRVYAYRLEIVPNRSNDPERAKSIGSAKIPASNDVQFQLRAKSIDLRFRDPGAELLEREK